MRRDVQGTKSEVGVRENVVEIGKCLDYLL